MCSAHVFMMKCCFIDDRLTEAISIRSLSLFYVVCLYSYCFAFVIDLFVLGLHQRLCVNRFLLQSFVCKFEGEMLTLYLSIFCMKLKTDRVLVSTGHRSVLYFGFWRVLWFILTAHKLLWAIFFRELSDFFQSQTLVFTQSSTKNGNVDNSTQKYNWDFIDF